MYSILQAATKTIIVVLFFGNSFSSHSQTGEKTTNTNGSKSDTIKVYSKDWITLYEYKSIQLMYKLTSCENGPGYAENLITFKVVNTTNSTIIFNYHKDLYYDNTCKTCDDYNGEYSVEVEVLPNSTVESTCDNELVKMNIFAGWAKNGDDYLLTQFQLTDIVLQTKEANKKAQNLSDNKSYNPPADVLNDPEKYKAWKENWIKENPEEYQKMQNQKKITIKRSEINSYPEEKRKYVEENSELYIIIED